MPNVDARPARAAFERGLAAFAEADYDDVVSGLADFEDDRSRLLRAWAQLRSDDHHAAIATLERRPLESRRLATLAQILTESMRCRLDVTREYAYQLPPDADDALRAWHGLFRVFPDFMHGRFDDCRRSCEFALAHGNSTARFAATELLGWTAFERGHYATAIPHFLHLLDAFAAGARRDQHMRANVVQGLAFASLSTLDTAHLERIVSELESFADTAYLRRSLVSAWSSVGALHSLRGDAGAEYRALHRARAVPARAPFVALPELRLAAYHRRTGDVPAAMAHLDFAAASFTDVDWPKAGLEERIILLAYAYELSHFDPNSASRAYVRAASSNGNFSRDRFYGNDRLARGLAILVSGRMLESHGDVGAARQAYERAAKILHASGDYFRGSVGALAYVRRGDGRDGSSALDVAIERAPKWWVSVEALALRAAAQAPLARLTPAERRVLEGICAGKTGRAIAAECGRSPSTVRNQTIAIFRKFSVSTRSELVAKVVGRG